ncbi:MAG: bifunctional oligoribonuclease/PAP phosphatase NrnA [Clostridiales bacterium]|nr:bifunctional oligoribonuclease/PAP phosphatase NrnA [Clostridiales bacterium]
MKKNDSLLEIATQLNKAKKVAIFCHARPDGDTIGSGTALCQALKNAGKTAFVICEEAPAEKFLFLDGVEEIKTELPQEEFDTFISVDCGELNRLGCFASLFSKFKGVTINIDHHVISNVGFAKYNYVLQRPATAEILPEVLQSAGFALNKKIANLIMLGLITDTGSFLHADVTENTFLVASILKKHGADVHFINYNLYSKQSKQRALLYGKVLSKIRFALEDKLGIITVSLDDMQWAGANKSMTEGFVDFALTIDSVEVSAAIMEVKANQYKVSLRSKGKVNVNAVASTFGGGGHVLASGCMLFGEYEEVIEKLTYAVYQNL